MAKEKGFGISEVTNRIYYGTKDTTKQEWVGDKKDVTKEAVGIVFEWFMGNMKNNGASEFLITYKGVGYELVMRRKEEKNETN